tara:strand:- start:137 stop:769 length:633 start_codon:yes stop_codon:yes gene_type:complete
MKKVRICKTCNKEFIPRTGRHIYCAEDCIQSGYKRTTVSFSDNPARICPSCNKEKHFKEFRKLKKDRGWVAQDRSRRYTSCKICERVTASERYRINGIHQRYNSIRNNAKKKNIVFKISKEYLAKLFAEAPDKCPIFGTKLGIVDYSPGNRDNTGDFRNSSFSIDRIVPELGYVEGNLIIVSDLANRIKNNATPDQVIKVGEFYKKLQEK